MTSGSRGKTVILFFMVSGSQDGEKTWRTTVDDRRRRHHTRRVERRLRTHVTDRRCRPLTRRVASIRHVTCRHQDFHVRCALRCPTHPHSNTPHRARRDVLAIDRRRPYIGSIAPRDYSRTKCFSCGQLGHTQVRCPKPDSSLPFRPSGWIDRSDGPQRRNGGPPQGNEI